MIEGSVVGYASLFFCYSFLVLVPVVVTVIVFATYASMGVCCLLPFSYCLAHWLLHNVV